MTIKEAFQKLANDLSASLRNPFFVGRTLHDDFADIADKIVDAGGSTVTVTPLVTEGTKIATITVDGTGKDLYAPSSGIDYSEAEQDTGLNWIDGSSIYQKTIHITSALGRGENVINHGITSFNKFVSCEGVGKYESDYLNIPYVAATDTYMMGVNNFNSTTLNIYISNSFNPANLQDVYITVKYTKS